MKKSLLALFLLSSAVVNAQELGTGFSHDFELTLTSTAITGSGFVMMDTDPVLRQYDFLAPVINTGLNVMYRASENDSYHWGEFWKRDCVGVGIAVLIHVLFPPAKETK